MYTPACDDEITGLVRYLDEQLIAIRAAATGLTEDQARSQPCRSTLSIGGLIKHATFCMRGVIERLTTADRRAAEAEETAGYDAAGYEAYASSFALGDDETAVGAVAEFDAVRVSYVAAVAATDPSGPTTEPPSPWFGIFDGRPAHLRYLLVHQIEEMARHAGHADILREELDGMAIPAIVLSEAGMPANDYFQPYHPAPGTIGAPAAAIAT